MSLAAPFRPILRSPTLLLAAVLLVLFGAHAATIAPYVSALAVTVFGLTDRAFSALLLAASLVAVSGSVGFGIWADRHMRRRMVALGAIGFLTAGTALMTFAPATPGFVLAHALLLPLSASIFGQIFALARLAASALPEAERGAVLSTLRALFALPWVVVLPLWSLVFQGPTPLTVLYPVCLVFALAMAGLAFAFWPRDGATPFADAPSGLSLGAALAEIAAPRVLARVLALGAVNGAVYLYMVLIGLIFAALPQRGAADTALYAGLVAGLEVPFMLALPFIAGRLSRPWLIFLGTALYALHLAGLPLLAPFPAVWGLVVFAALGGALVLTQPMAYLQELMAARPGAGAALMALQKLAGDGFTAACFALGTAVSGYGLAAALGAGAAVLGAGLLVWLDRRPG